MTPPQLGEVVLHKSTRTNHVVEHVETIDGKTYIFTEDIKCFPLENLLPLGLTRLKNVFSKFLDGEKLDKEELEVFENKMSKLGMNPILHLEPFDLDEYMSKKGLNKSSRP